MNNNGLKIERCETIAIKIFERAILEEPTLGLYFILFKKVAINLK